MSNEGRLHDEGQEARGVALIREVDEEARALTEELGLPLERKYDVLSLLYGDECVASDSASPAGANKAIVRRFFEEVVNEGNLDVVDELVSANVFDWHPVSNHHPGPEGIKQDIRDYRHAFPDLTVAIQKVIQEDDEVVTLETWSGTHRQPYHDIPPEREGAVLSMTRVHIFRIAGGEIVEIYAAGEVRREIRSEVPSPLLV